MVGCGRRETRAPVAARAAGTRRRARARPGRLRPVRLGLVRRARRLGRRDGSRGLARAPPLARGLAVARAGVRGARLGCASWLWSDRRAQTVLELRRTAVYAAAVLALVVLVRRGTPQHLLVLTHAAIVAVVVYALARYLTETRAIDPFEGTLLSQPLGYANALAALAAIGVVLGVGLAAGTHEPWARAAVARIRPSAGGRPPADAKPRRSSSRSAPASPSSSCARTTSAPFVRAALVVAPGSARRGDRRLGVAARRCERDAPCARRVDRRRGDDRVRGRHGDRSRRVSGRDDELDACRGLAVATALTLAARRRRRRDRLDTASLFALGRRVARVRAHVAGGSGAGHVRARLGSLRASSRLAAARSTHTRSTSRRSPSSAQSGSSSLLAFLALPLTRLSRLKSGNAPIAAGAYVVFLVHAGLDWDWEMPAVVLAGLCCGAVALASGEAQPRPVKPSGRATIVALALALGALSIAGARSSSEPGVAPQLGLAVLGARVAVLPAVVPVTLPVLLLRSGLGRAGRERVAVAQVRLQRLRRHGDQAPRVLLRVRAVADRARGTACTPSRTDHWRRRRAVLTA